MLLDKQNLFSDAQAATTGTQLSTDKIDLRGITIFRTDNLGNTPPDDPGRSPEIDVLVRVTTTFTGGTSLAVNLVADDDPALGSPTILQSSGAIAEASLIAGYNFKLQIPPGIAVADRYLGLQFVTVGAHGAGAITAGIIPRGEKQTAPGSFT